MCAMVSVLVHILKCWSLKPQSLDYCYTGKRNGYILRNPGEVTDKAICTRLFKRQNKIACKRCVDLSSQSTCQQLLNAWKSKTTAKISNQPNKVGFSAQNKKEWLHKKDTYKSIKYAVKPAGKQGWLWQCKTSQINNKHNGILKQTN